MKSGDIKNAYEAVKTDAYIKEKILLRAEEAYENNIPVSENGKTSHTKIKKGGAIRRAVSTVFAMAAAAAVVFALKSAVPQNDFEPVPPAESAAVESATAESTAAEVTAAEENEPLPPNTAEVVLKVVDQNGVFVKNKRVDYFPAVPRTETKTVYDGLAGKTLEKEITRFYFDKEKADKAGTVPITYEESAVLRLEYGDYIFVVSDALANDTFSVFDYEMYLAFQFIGQSSTGESSTQITVDENTSEIILKVYVSDGGYSNPEYSKGEIILQDAEGDPMPGWTVILKPVSGEMAEGYSGIYGGYVLPRTDKNGSSVWNHPIEGTYTVIAYKERLHTEDVPITEPFVIDGDSTFTYEKKQTVLTTYKIFKQVPETS